MAKDKRERWSSAHPKSAKALANGWNETQITDANVSKVFGEGSKVSDYDWFEREPGYFVPQLRGAFDSKGSLQRKPTWKDTAKATGKDLLNRLDNSVDAFGAVPGVGKAASLAGGGLPHVPADVAEGAVKGAAGVWDAAKTGWKAFRASRAAGKAAATAAKAASEAAPAAAQGAETLGQVAANLLKPKNLLKVGAGGAAIMVGKDQISTAMKNYQDRQNTALKHEEELKNQRAQNQYAEELAASPRMQEEKLNSARAVMTTKLQDEAARIWEAANRQKNTLYAPLSADIFQSSLAIYQPEVARQMKGP